VLYNEGSYHLLQESGKLILSFDGLFGLPRKTAAGSSYRKPLHGNLMFCEQSEVDSFVSAYPKPKKVTMVSVGSVQCRFFYYTKFALYFKTRVAVTSQLEVLCVQPVATMPLMKLVYLVVHVGMNFQGYF